MGGPTRSSGVGASVISSSLASIPTVLPDITLPFYIQPRVTQVHHYPRAAVCQSLAYSQIPLASSGLDQLRFTGGDSVYVIASASLSPTSLLFPLPRHPSSSLPPSSSSSPFPLLPLLLLLLRLLPLFLLPLSPVLFLLLFLFPLSQLPPMAPSSASFSVPSASFPGSLSSTVPFPGYPSIPSSSSSSYLSSVSLSSLPPSSSSLLAVRLPPPPLTSSSSFGLASSSSSFPSGFPPPPPPASSSSFPVSSSYSPSDFSSWLADFHKRVLWIFLWNMWIWQNGLCHAILGSVSWIS